MRIGHAALDKGARGSGGSVRRRGAMSTPDGSLYDRIGSG
jgi:hypothetical protein